MKKLLTALGVLVLAVGIGVLANYMLPMPSFEALEPTPSISAVESPKPQPSASPLPDKEPTIHILPVSEAKDDFPAVIVLGSKNTLVLRGVVDEKSVANLQKELMQMSAKLPKSETIYLVMDTPGGSVLDGDTLIDTMRAIPQKIKTISLFAASMGFQIVQNGDERLVTPSGVLMSHRGAMDGVGGQISSDGKGSLLTRLNFFIRIMLELDNTAASRMHMSLKDYQALIADEYWVHGQDAVKDKAADRVVLARCSDELASKADTSVMQIFIFTVKVTMSKCPLIQGPLDLQVIGAGDNKAEVENFVNLMYYNKPAFVHKYIETGEYARFLN